MRNVPVWDDGDWRPLPHLEGAVEADVCVVGLGGSGLAAVARLQEHGRSVIGIDAGTVAGGAAGRNGGFLLAGTAAFHHDAVRELGRQRAVALHRLTLQEIDRMAAETPESVRRVGSLRIATTPGERDDCEEQIVAMRADDLPVERYDGPEGAGLLFPADASLQPLRRCRRLATRACERGAHLYERTPATRLAGDEVLTPHGRVGCGAVIVAVDGGLERLLPELAGQVRTARLQMLATAPTDEITVPRPVYLRYGHEYYQQTEDGRVALGGFRDRVGASEWTTDPEPSEEVQGRLERYLRERLGVRAPVTHRWAASVGYARGVVPVAREVRPHVRAIGGYNGTGNVVGALLGRAIADDTVHGDGAVSALFR